MWCCSCSCSSGIELRRAQRTARHGGRFGNAPATPRATTDRGAGPAWPCLQTQGRGARVRRHLLRLRFPSSSLLRRRFPSPGVGTHRTAQFERAASVVMSAVGLAGQLCFSCWPLPVHQYSRGGRGQELRLLGGLASLFLQHGPRRTG